MRLLNSIPFRLAIAFTILYLVCMSIGTFVHYNSMRESVRAQIDRSLVEKHELANKIFTQVGIDAVTRVVSVQNNVPMEYSLGYHLESSTGERLAGNLDSAAKDGWSDVHASEIGMRNDQTYRFYSSKIGDNVFSTGRSMSALDDLRIHSVKSYLATSAVTLMIAWIGAIVLASRSHSRVRGIVNSMDRVARGNLDARLPISQRDDDIDMLSGNMNDALSLLQLQVNGMKQVSADIAHDLKTPLNRLYIRIEEAVEKSHRGESVVEELEAAAGEAADINSTFEALLRIAQIEAGARKSKFVGLDLLPTLHTAAEVYDAVVEEQEQTFQLVLDPSVELNAGLHLIGDKDLLLQMIVNLIENAIRHCPKGTHIELSSGVANGAVWLSVSDNGPGIPAEDRDKVFQRLYRLEKSRTTPGSGLGLSLVKAVADLHCATITVGDNEPGLIIKLNFDKDCPVD